MTITCMVTTTLHTHVLYAWFVLHDKTNGSRTIEIMPRERERGLRNSKITDSAK